MSGKKPPLTTCDKVIAKRTGSINPASFPGETFELFSVPAFDRNAPEIVLGEEIGSTKQIVQAGDVLLSKIVPHIRRTWVVEPVTNHRLIASGEWIVFRSQEFDARFLRHLLVSDGFHRHFMATVSGIGGSLLRARPSEVAKIAIPQPPIEEQRRIGAILDKAESVHLKRELAIRLADDLLRALFLDMFGNPMTNPKGWPVGTVRDLVASANYGTSKKAREAGGAFPILRMNNLTYSGRMNLSSLKYVDLEPSEEPKYLARRGDLLFNRTNSKELVGKTAVYECDEPMAIAGYLVRVRTNERGRPHYLSAYLNSAHGKQVLQSKCKSIIGMANINAQELQNIEIMIPPRALQDRYAEIVERTREFENRLTASLEQLESIKASLSHRLFC